MGGSWPDLCVAFAGFCNPNPSLFALPVLKTLEIWRASASILRERRLQTLIAAQHCSYPGLLPAELRDKVGSEDYETEIQALKLALKM